MSDPASYWLYQRGYWYSKSTLHVWASSAPRLSGTNSSWCVWNWRSYEVSLKRQFPLDLQREHRCNLGPQCHKTLADTQRTHMAKKRRFSPQRLAKVQCVDKNIFKHELSFRIKMKCICGGNIRALERYMSSKGRVGCTSCTFFIEGCKSKVQDCNGS